MSTQHPLVEYAKKNGESMKAIAERAGCSRMQLYRVMNGENTTTNLLERISAATGGKVKVVHLLAKPETAA